MLLKIEFGTFDKAFRVCQRIDQAGPNPGRVTGTRNSQWIIARTQPGVPALVGFLHAMDIRDLEIQLFGCRIAEAVRDKTFTEHPDRIEHALHMKFAVCILCIPARSSWLRSPADIEEDYPIGIQAKEIDGAILPLWIRRKILHGLVPANLFHMLHGTADKMLEYRPGTEVSQVPGGRSTAVSHREHGHGSHKP